MFLSLRTNKNSVTESASNLDELVLKASNKLFPKALKRGFVVNDRLPTALSFVNDAI